jgi:hypothetical protein
MEKTAILATISPFLAGKTKEKQAVSVSLGTIHVDPARELDIFYHNIQCAIVQVIHIKLLGETVMVYMDEEGKFKNTDYVTGFYLTDDDDRVWDLAGNLIFTQDNTGETFGVKHLETLLQNDRLRPGFFATLT